jgi:D-aminoacyl-tRNA deacylase
MRLVIQRVQRAKVSVDQKSVAEIQFGLLILLGIEKGDTQIEAKFLAEKCALLRILDDSDEKPNLSLLETKGEALVVSQFTLCADARGGRRPSYTDAAPPEIAAPLVDYFAAQMVAHGVPTQTGAFGAHMIVELVNDGPFTIVLDKKPPA